MLRSFLLAASFLFATQAHAGISTNGAAFQMEEDNVWFLGSQTVEYCIDGAGFDHRGQTALNKIVKESFADWKAFIETYGLDKLEFEHLKGEKRLKLALNFKRVARCSRPLEQIQFLFGITNNEVTDALEHQEGSIALNVRGIYNHDTYRNGGTIYVADVEMTTARLRHIVLHEIGHIFGFPHDSVHVMNSEVAYELADKTKPDFVFGRIESSTWKYRLTRDSEIQYGLSTSLRVDPEAMTAELKTGDQTLKGNFQIDPAFPTDNHGPRVHVIMQCSECLYSPDCSAFCGSRGLGITKYLDPMSPFHALNGSFTDGKAVYPAMIVNEHGTHVRLFDLKANKWKTFD